MCAALNCAPVVACSDRHGINTVHDALVVSRSAELIRIRKRPRVKNCVDLSQRKAILKHAMKKERKKTYHLLARQASREAQQVLLPYSACLKRAQHSEVGEDAKADLAACKLLDAGRNALGHAVDTVGAHRVAHIHDEMHDQLLTADGVDLATGEARGV